MLKLNQNELFYVKECIILYASKLAGKTRLFERIYQYL